MDEDMHKRVFFLIGLFLLILLCIGVFAQDEYSSEEFVMIATNIVKAKGIDLSDVEIIYDDGNKLWDEQVGKYAELVNSPNFAIFKNGFMKNYRTVYFDFKEPLPDIWVFMDKDTGEVLEVFKQQ